MSDRCAQLPKVKRLIDFNKNNCNSIKYLAVKKNAIKNLIFSKISFASFIQDVIDVFVIPEDNTRGAFLKCNMINLISHRSGRRGPPTNLRCRNDTPIDT